MEKNGFRLASLKKNLLQFIRSMHHNTCSDHSEIKYQGEKKIPEYRGRQGILYIVGQSISLLSVYLIPFALHPFFHSLLL
jgi:hypothetical protein